MVALLFHNRHILSTEHLFTIIKMPFNFIIDRKLKSLNTYESKVLIRMQYTYNSKAQADSILVLHTSKSFMRKRQMTYQRTSQLNLAQSVHTPFPCCLHRSQIFVPTSLFRSGLTGTWNLEKKNVL